MNNEGNKHTTRHLLLLLCAVALLAPARLMAKDGQLTPPQIIHSDAGQRHLNSSHLRASARTSSQIDLDGDQRLEEILVVPFGENEEGQFLYLAVLDDNGDMIWTGPKEFSTENPLILGEWHFGISLPEVVGDIDGDGQIELVVPAPQSDVSPTSFRILRWHSGSFEPIYTSTLMETPQGTGRFIWSDRGQATGTWVAAFDTIPNPGAVEVKIVEYHGGTDVNMYRALLRRDATGFTFQGKLGKTDNHGDNLPPTNPDSYRALLGHTDHVNSKGVRLSDVASILRQDRANYHHFQRRDHEDGHDRFFSSASERASIGQMPIRCNDPDWERRIINGTPLVEISVRRHGLELHILHD